MRVSVIHLRALLRGLESLGYSGEAAFATARIDLGRVTHDESWVTLEELDALTCAAMRLCADPAFGIRWAEKSSALQFDVPALLLTSACTLRDGFRELLRIQSILGDRNELSLSEHAREAELRFEPFAVSEDCARIRSDLFVTGFHNLFMLMGADSEQIHGVSLKHARPSYGFEYELKFGERVQFAQGATSVRFARELLDRPFHTPNPSLYRLLKQHAQDLHARAIAGDSLQSRIKQLMRSTYPVVLSAREAAAAIGLSDRSLRRRLASDRSTYSQLLQESRLDLVIELMRDRDRPLKQIAAEVGFADLAAFGRAFKRWTGRTPSEYQAAIDA